MKQSILIFLTLVSFQISFSQSTTQTFVGNWVSEKKSVKEKYLPSDNVLSINKANSSWTIFSNQLSLTLSTKLVGSTLNLFFENYDAGRGFMNFKGSFPKQKTLFAKCIFKSPNELVLTYLDEAFVDAVRDYMNLTKEEKDLIFPSVLYLNKNK
jgi:hypothetical protein